MERKQINFRPHDLTNRQIRELVTMWGCTITSVIARCVDRVYREEKKTTLNEKQITSKD